MGEVLDLVSTMNISWQSASRVIDAVNAGASIWGIISIIVAGGGILGMGYAALALLVKKKVKDLGETAAIAW
ncbi:circular bacteriocin, circularin A/uberolysin family [Paenibacillus larvae subsp. larvae]|uniref:Circular bacteriocin, circularin A/uberolysin family n=1 Tax=Paenibacillus larvae subsp. larvae TaxID=147375 RepID=A0A2L1UDK2_9BACL|nr:uberolysin/carnocyclin family circular bacteriocin [Paenibacillus larvae]AQT86585.1 circular bacteriocin, circularin A/uberolysin family protein [Paenibacillus larvae subsp. pulvifaciens]AQZ48263.1 circular bacteriocin, circularin A/uberolysin family protein [Paenibacillus larvae subsp. pulvifaciens]AVF26238.1 circular bacteriocin, circularin A/uberolysin family [Paenibacillus larvae subsp. larvae]AVF31015.1 circular bacteriocin, circularin A/uberolysin family [Paenibacillus larvae subsp. la